MGPPSRSKSNRGGGSRGKTGVPSSAPLTLVSKRKEERKAARKNKRAARGGGRRRTGGGDDDLAVPPPGDERVPCLQAPAKKTTAQKAKKRREGGDRDGTAAAAGDAPDEYAGMEPAVAAAMRADDEIIRELEERLMGGSGGRRSKRGREGNADDDGAGAAGRRRLDREYAAQEGFGADFGSFLDRTGRMAHDILTGGGGATTPGGYGASESEGPSSGEESDDEDEVELSMKGPVLSDDDWDDEDGEGGDDGEISEDSDSSDDDGPGAAAVSSEHTYRPADGEDIYGKSLPAPSSAAAPAKYVPPHLRARAAAADGTSAAPPVPCAPAESPAEASARRTVTSTMNRLTESTLQNCVAVLATLFGADRGPSVPGPVLRSALSDAAERCCVHDRQLMDNAVPVYACALALVHHAVPAAGIGGHLVEAFGLAFHTALGEARRSCAEGTAAATDDAGNEAAGGYQRRASNLALLLCYLYNFGLVHCAFVYGVVRDLIQSMAEVDAEILLLTLRHCGARLRADDPAALGKVVGLVREGAAAALAKGNGTARVKYMVDAIVDLKNNRRRTANEAGAERTARLRKFVGRARADGDGAATCSKITLADLLDIPERGRWWRVGAFWAGARPDDPTDGGRGATDAAAPADGPAHELLVLAGRQRMNTDVRRSVFCVVAGSTDCEDAAVKLAGLGLKGAQDREVARVLVDCCGQEGGYNPYYGLVALRVCDRRPAMRFTFRLTYWDTFKQFGEMGARRAANLAKLMCFLVRERVLNAKVLAPLDMSSLPENGVIFLTVFFSALFDGCDAEELGNIFSKVRGDGDDESGLCDSITLFLMTYVKRSPKNVKKSQFHSNYKTSLKLCKTRDVMGF